MLRVMTRVERCDDTQARVDSLARIRTASFCHLAGDAPRALVNPATPCLARVPLPL
jgi:hypothetical protein